MPAYKKKGETALLECRYELKNVRTVPEDDGTSGLFRRRRRRRRGHQHKRNYNEQYDDHFEEDNYRRIQPEEPNGDNDDDDNVDDVVDGGGGGGGDGVGSIVSREALYSVKWYKDNEEFYRYLPKSNPPQHSYRVEGIRVDVSIGRSNISE